MENKSKYSRVLLKVSGEALSDGKFGISDHAVSQLCEQIKRVVDMGVQIGIVVGGGNFWRSRQSKLVERTSSDYMGMLATAINALCLQNALEKIGLQTRVQTSIKMEQIAEPVILRRAVRHLEKGRVVIFACGTGSPYFTTDSAAALRAAEMRAECLLCAKAIDAVYDSDPAINKDAKRFDHLNYMDVIRMNLKVMDTAAISLCMDNNIPILIFSKDDYDGISDALCGKKVGTIIDNN